MRRVFREENEKENCEIRASDNVQGQVYEYVFTPRQGYCIYFATCVKKQVYEQFLFSAWVVFFGVISGTTL